MPSRLLAAALATAALSSTAGAQDAPPRPRVERAPLMPWQRSLEDALAVVARTGKPLLICVNVDGEPASEALARGRYRDPAFAELARGFVPVLASPDRHTVRDHDDRGRRIVDPVFGRVTSAEHIEIEPVLYERWFGGQRVAPRHIGVSAAGEVLFDLFLLRDLGAIDDALRRHGVREAALPAAETLDEVELLQSPDAAHRAALEQRFEDADEETRRRLAGLALSRTRTTQHPEIARLALRDPAPEVRRTAARALAEAPQDAPLELFPRALLACAGDAAGAAALVDALYRRASAESSVAAQQRARGMMRAFASLELVPRLIDVPAWRAALREAPPVPEPPPPEQELEALDRRLAELESNGAASADDPSVALDTAAVTMRYAQIRLAQGSDPTFLLHDVRAAADRARRGPDLRGRAQGYAAWASHLLGETEEAGSRAAAALPDLAGEAGSVLAAHVLDVFARARVREIYAAMAIGEDWPASWVPEARAAYELLLDHPAGTDEHVAAYVDFLGALEAWSPRERALRRGLARFPISPALHERLRATLLETGGARALEDAYAAIRPAPAHVAHLQWFAGLAALVAAEREVECGHVAPALAAYGRSIAQLRDSVAAEPSFAGSAYHYVCLAGAGAARLHAAAGAWDAALAAICDAIAASPASASTKDGLDVSPAETAAEVARGAAAAGRVEGVARLRAVLEEHGIRLPS